MIRTPRRSVTRFFIPLIDVLILLFSVYLLLPLASSEEKTRTNRIEQELEIERRLAERERARKEGEPGTLPANLLEQIERLKKEKAQVLQERLAVRVLEIDGETGRLFFRKDGRKIEIDNAGEARQLIDTDRAKYATKGKELFYLILYPRDRNSEHPTVAERERFDNWFEGVAKAYDTPNSVTGPGGSP
jgi:hypothetical protein